MYHRHGFPIIDVTNKPIEEIASEILATRATGAARRRRS